MKAVNQKITDEYAIYQGDSCELMQEIPDESIDFGIHSPPFIGLYKFSNSDRDISNNEGESFWQHYGFIIDQLFRITKPGRLHCVHCMQLPTSKTKDGFIGIRDFRGDIVRAYLKAGWIYHSEVCIWKDPVVAQQRTKSLRLLHKQIVKDSSMSGQGLADYVLTFRKPGDNECHISGCFNDWIGEGDGPSRDKYTFSDDNRNWYSIEVWQKYASPVWGDIRQGRTLQYRGGRDQKDEQHIAPLQLDVIERCLDLWSLPGETVFTPFMGIGSEVWCAVNKGRKGIGIELKQSYYDQSIRNLNELKNKTANLFKLQS